jgi:lantibiotic biosynthesis protein
MSVTTEARPWSAVVNDPARVDTVVAVAREVMSRLRDPQAADDAAATANAQSVGLTGRAHWVPHGVAQGHCGLAIACGYFDRCFPGEGWDTAAHDHLTRAAEGAAGQGIRTLGLFAGLSGLAFATAYLSRRGTRYGTLLAHLDETLLDGIPAWLGDTVDAGVPVGAFDLISGWTGAAAYLLGRNPGPGRDAALQAILSRLVDLTMVVDGRPKWHTPGPLIVDADMARRYPGGVLNCGMAHGIAGPLALLCLAHQSGVRVPGMVPAIRRTATWLRRQRVDDSWGASFPAVVALGPDAPAATPARNAWCYGAPGVARALWLAGVVLPDPELQSLSVATIDAVMRRPVASRRVDAPGFCHGIAGLLQITLRFAQDPAQQRLRPGVDSLVAQLLAAYDPEAPLGYRSIEAGGARVDRPGLLEGAPAVAMSLLAAVRPEAPGWDRLFLLS